MYRYTKSGPLRSGVSKEGLGEEKHLRRELYKVLRDATKAIGVLRGPSHGCGPRRSPCLHAAGLGVGLK